MAGRDDYVEVKDRIADFRTRFPEGRFQPFIFPDGKPYAIETLPDGRTFVVYVAEVYRTADGPVAGIGSAWEPYPGPTNFTRDSELQNAETSAWGRALIAALIADSTRGIATRDDVDARSGSDTGERLATDNQIRTLEREIETRGLPDGIPWPIPHDPRPTMRVASEWIDAVKAQPRETPPPERVSTFRRDLETAAAAIPASGSSDAVETLPGDGGANGESSSRPWERRAFPFDADGPAIGRLWKTWIAAVPGIGPAKLLTTARTIAEENGLPLPSSIDEIADPELVNAVRLWLSNRADERGAHEVANA